MSSLELTARPTSEEVVQLRRQAYCNAYAHWMQTRGLEPDKWGFLDPDAPKTRQQSYDQEEAKLYARQMADLVVAALLQEYR